MFSSPGVDKFEVHVNTEDKNAARSRRGAFNQDATSFSSCSKDSGAREAYIAAQLNKDQTKGTFTVGDNKVYNDYWNCPLVKGNMYSIYYAAVAKNEAGVSYIIAVNYIMSDKTQIMFGSVGSISIQIILIIISVDSY